jgi:hypothetical protein
MIENNKFRQCIVCEKKYNLSQEELYMSLRNFEDACICNDCLEKENEGWPRKSQKQVKVKNIDEIFKN